MGLVYEDITIKNAGDVTSVRRGYVKEPEIRQISITALVDTGAETLVISEALRQELGLEVVREKKVSLADKSSVLCPVTEAIEIHWKDRSTVAQALVLQETNEVLLGAIPLEGLNVMIDPGNQKLVGIHGDEVIYRI